MSADLTIAPGGSVAVPPAAPAPPRLATAAALPLATQPGTPNPTLQLDPALGLVVLELHQHGDSTPQTIPSQQQLAAYRTGAATPPGRADIVAQTGRTV